MKSSKKVLVIFGICLGIVFLLVLLANVTTPTVTSKHKELLASDKWVSDTTSVTISFTQSGEGSYFDGEKTYSFRWTEMPDNADMIQLSIVLRDGTRIERYELDETNGVVVLKDTAWDDVYVRECDEN